MADTNIGTLLLHDALPEDLRKESYKLDKAGIHELMRQVAEKHPDRYKEVLQKLNDIGRNTVYSEGHSASLSALKKSPAKEKMLAEARQQVQGLIDNNKLTDADREKQIINTLMPLGPKLTEALYEEAKQEKNPYYLQLISGSRGKKSDYNSLRGAELLTSDHNNKIVPIPIFNSYADGLDPAEYFASSFAQRRGAIGVKFATGDAGFLNKQLVNASHRMVVDKENPEPTRLPVGLPVDPKDADNAGSVLAVDAGPYKAGQVLSPQMLKDLEEKGLDEIVIHSPMTESTPDGGVSRQAAGRRDRFGLSKIGDNIGIPAAQSIGEKLSQGALGSKHNSAMAKARQDRSGFDYINRLIQAPEQFPEAGPLAEHDGIVGDIKAAPQGGHYIHVGDTKHWVHPDLNPTVKTGDTVEAGDDLTDGIPHPTELVRHRGIGEARRVYTGLLREALDNSGVSTHRRNLEAVVAGLINWTKITHPDGVGDHIADDVVSYNSLTHGYQPREGSKLTPPSHAVGRYLEEPALHYTVGTRVTRRVAGQLKKHGIRDIHSHEDPPAFEPHMQRGLLGVHSDEDPLTQQSGFYNASAFAKSLSRGAESNPNSTSYVPALAKGVDFGKNLAETGHYGPKPLQ